MEEVEDTELVHAVAPDATIRELLVDPADVSTPAKFAATFASYVRTAVSNGEVMSQSGIGQDFNVGESSWTSAEVATMNSALEYAAARHVTVVVASGDYGAIGNGSSKPLKEVSLPASDPWALAAGGTTLTANPVTGAYLSETAWNDQSGSPDASGGGFSRLFARPSYQNGVPGIGATRGVPDVAGEATGTSGMALAFSAPGGGDEFVGAGGTSAAAPFWAGLIALADQEAGHPLGFVNPAIYRIAQSPLYHKAFHDITTGNNTVSLNGVTVTGYEAGTGWDPVTGWGTPDAQVLIPLLAQLRQPMTPGRFRLRSVGRPVQNVRPSRLDSLYSLRPCTVSRRHVRDLPITAHGYENLHNEITPRTSNLERQPQLLGGAVPRHGATALARPDSLNSAEETAHNVFPVVPRWRRSSCGRPAENSLVA